MADHQDCKDCPLYKQSLGGMFADAMQKGIVELGGVGPVWDDDRFRRGATATVYEGDRCQSADGETGEEALRKAEQKMEGAEP